MNTNVNAKRILFYGDSLVYGKKAGANERLNSNERFTGVIQDILGSDYEIIEEGLRARNFAGENPHFPDRDGLKQCPAIVASHIPIDIFVLFLGTNDCNKRTDFDTSSIADNLSKYQEILAQYCQLFAAAPPRSVVVLPPYVRAADFDAGMLNFFETASEQRIIEFRTELRKAAEKANLLIFDASEHCEASPKDGIHLEPKQNKRLAIALSTFLTSI